MQMLHVSKNLRVFTFPPSNTWYYVIYLDQSFIIKFPIKSIQFYEIQKLKTIIKKKDALYSFFKNYQVHNSIFSHKFSYHTLQLFFQCHIIIFNRAALTLFTTAFRLCPFDHKCQTFNYDSFK